jgi:hypothetical protein
MKFYDINSNQILLFFLILLKKILEIIEKHGNFRDFYDKRDGLFVILVKVLLVGAFHGIYLIFTGISCFVHRFDCGLHNRKVVKLLNRNPCFIKSEVCLFFLVLRS